MSYESLVEVGAGLDLVRIQLQGSPEERDMLTSLRGFQLRSDVVVRGASPPSPNDVLIAFVSWKCRIKDRYDFDYTEHFTVPNPDHGSSAQAAVRPKDKSLTVYHRNAQRLEAANLAAPYNIESDEWSVVDESLLSSASVNPERQLQ